MGSESSSSLLSTAAPIIGAGIDAVASVGGGLFSANQARKNRAFQERMYYQQLADNRENWRMMNAYNLPSAQLQRLRDANLNPLLMYSNGASGVTAASPANGANAPSGSQAQANFQTNFGKGLYDAALIRSELDQRKANTRVAMADSELKIAQALSEASRNENLQADTDLIKAKSKYEWDSLRSRLENIQLQNKREESAARLNDALAQTEPVKRKEIESNIQRNDALIDDIENQIKNRDIITTAQAKQIHQDIKNSVAITAANVALMDAQARKAAADAAAVEIDNLVKELNFGQYERLTMQKLKADVYKAISEGNKAVVEHRMTELLLRYMPRPGSKAEKFRYYNENYVFPLLKVLSSGGAAGLITKIL